MYYSFYNLKENPFNVTSDPAFFFTSAQHAEAFSHLIYGIEQRKGILVVTGEIGTGKTTLCRALLNRLNNNIKTALILNSNFSELQLLQLIIRDLGIECKRRDKFSLVNALNDFLIEQTTLGNNVVIIIDEVQNLKVKQLEQIRLLSNLETEKEKLLQIILVGQPELYDKLKRPSLRQLNQRISVRFHVMPLEQSEIRDYINHRLKVAGHMSTPAKINFTINFTPKAVDAIYYYSQGTPRLINILCDRSLLAGYVAETFTIEESIVHKCAKEAL